MEIALFVLLYLLIFFYLYILVMGIYRAYLTKQLSTILVVLCSIPVAIGLIIDVLANIFIATIVFRSLPREWLVTTRLSKILRDDNAHIHNKIIATYVCHKMLDIFDPTSNHCV